VSLVTRPGGRPWEPAPGFSPTLLFHKWHSYDGGKDHPLDTKESRLPFLEQVAGASNELTGGGRAAVYRAWHGRYRQALEGLGIVQRGAIVEAETVWRLVSGFATNPALESGLTLHPLHGFPYLPGSAVRGLVRHVAEMGLLAGERESWTDLEDLPPAADRVAFLDEAETLQAMLGSLTVEPLYLPREGDPRKCDPRPPFPPRAVLRRWKQADLDEEEKKRVRDLLDLHTGGVVSFYDAVPAPGQPGLVQLDLLNPHYPEYYDHAGAHPPSDDQNPRPVYFLAVKPGARFLFPFLLRRWPEREQRLRGLTPAGTLAKLTGWLVQGLTSEGAGGKTAAGYGYFQVTGPERDRQEERREPRAGAVVAPGAPPAGPDWEARVRGIGMGEADRKVPELLKELTGEARRLAARALLAKFKKNLREEKHRTKPWALKLREAAQET
jgi:CRISPR type III-B/RAMP module RAMP protein Cmr6